MAFSNLIPPQRLTISKIDSLWVQVYISIVNEMLLFLSYKSDLTHMYAGCLKPVS